MSIRENILNADDRLTTTIIVTEWNCELALRALSDAEIEALTASAEIQPAEGSDDATPRDDIRTRQARVIVAAALGDNGVPMFSEADIPLLAGKSRFILDRVTATVLQLTGISPRQIAERRMYSQHIQDLSHMAARLGIPLSEFLARVGLAEREIKGRKDDLRNAQKRDHPATQGQEGAAQEPSVPAGFRELKTCNDMSMTEAFEMAAQFLGPKEMINFQAHMVEQHQRYVNSREKEAAKSAGENAGPAPANGASS